jgi:alkylation response protein AidB-like acyl-CoA dehydrogenase
MAQDPLDWPFFAPRHRALAASLRHWSAAPVLPADAASLLAALGEAGWLAEAVPEDGQCHDCRALFLVRETLAACDARADRALLAQAMAAAPLLFAGSPEQRAQLAAARRGSWRVAPAGFAASPAFSLAEEGDALHVAGSARVPFGAAADAFTLIAGEGAQRTALLVGRDAPGVTLAAEGEDAELTLSHCRLPVTARIGAAGDGARLAALTRELFAASAAAAALGLARLVLDHVATRAADRAAFGRRLVEYHEVQGRLAAMATRIEAARLALYRAAWARDVDGSRMPRETSMARLAAFEAARAAIGEAETILAGEAGWLAAILGRWHLVAEGYDKELEALLLAGQTLNQLRPGRDGWHGRPRAVAGS